MESQKTLISIASVSQRVAHAIAKHAGTNSPESLELQRIVVASQAILEALNRASLSRDATLDDRLVGWLSTKEPGMCLETLLRMEEVFGLTPTSRGTSGAVGFGLGLGVQSLFRAAMSAPMKTRIDEAYLMFLKRRDCFHFLTESRIWNREQGAQQQSGAGRLMETTVSDTTNRIKERERENTSLGTAGTGSHRMRGIDLEKMEKALEWLDGLNCRAKQEDTLGLRQPDTCTWLLKMNAYKTWRNGEQSFLWLNGKPGAGKSVMGAAVIEDLKSTLQEDEDLVYFFCDFRTERSISAAETMRSLVWQLLKQLHTRGIYPRDAVENLVEEKAGGASTLTNPKCLALHVSRIIKQFPRPPIVVIDALDECKEIEELLSALAELKTERIRLFVTSRPLEVIKDSFSNLPSVSMDEMKYELSSDIRLHVTREFDSHRRLRRIDANFKDEIRSKLCDRADGMFRWVQCQIDTLKGCATVLEVRNAMDSLPSGLEETYTRILQGINKESPDGKLALRALVWLVAALRELKLKEIIEGLTIDLQQRALDRKIRPMHGHVVLDALGSLITHYEDTDIVILSHFSVKEYLTGATTRTRPSIFHINPEHAHGQLAQFCMCYISFCLRSMKLLVGEKARRIKPSHAVNAAAAHPLHHHSTSLPDSLPLLPYIFFHGFQHLAYVVRGQTAVISAIIALHKDVQGCLLEWERLRTEQSHYKALFDHSCLPWPTPHDDFVPYILVCFASAFLLRASFKHISFRSRNGMNPLVYAASLGKVEHAKALLFQGAELRHADQYPEFPGLPWGLPLEAACYSGNSVLVDFFLDQGSPVPEALFKGRSYRCARINTRLIQTDEFVEWAINAPNEDLLRYVLHYLDIGVDSWIPSEEEMATRWWRLSQIGCDLSTQDSLWEAHLRKFALVGHIFEVEHMLSQPHPSFPHDIILQALGSTRSNPEIIRLFLSKGCDPFATSVEEDTALHLAIGSYISEYDCLEVVKILTDAGCDPFTPNLADETPIHIAARRGYVSVVEHLLSLRVDMPLPSNILLSALEISLDSKTAPIIRWLCRMGANIHVCGANGDTVLHLALEGWEGGPELEADRLCIARILIESGCSPLVPNFSGETPLHVAARCREISVLEYMLSLGLSLPADILLSACRHPFSHRAPMVQFLLAKGANANASSPNGDNALHIAIRRIPFREPDGGLEIVRILIHAGCDPCMRNSAGETPSHLAAEFQRIAIMEYLLSRGTPFPSDIIIFSSQYEGPVDATLRFLIEKGADIRTVGGNGDTVLHLVAACGAVDLAQLLVEGGCSYHTLNVSGETPLHIAALHGHIPMIEYLSSLYAAIPSDILLAASGRHSRSALPKAPVLDFFINRGAGIDVVTAHGKSPLHLLLNSEMAFHSNISIEDDYVESVRILHNSGCRLDVRDERGRTLMHAAARRSLIPVMEHLLSQDITLPPDTLLASGRSIFRSLPKLIQFLVSKGADVHAVAPNEDTVLHHILAQASYDEDGSEMLECAKLLVSLGCQPFARNLAGETPLHVAARWCPLSVVKYLLSQGASLPSNILLSVWQVNLKMFRFLIREGADVHAVMPDGNTPLHLALLLDFASEFEKQTHEGWEIIQILLEHGSDPSARNGEGQTCFDLAEANGPFFLQNFRRLAKSCRISESIAS